MDCCKCHLTRYHLHSYHILNKYALFMCLAIYGRASDTPTHTKHVTRKRGTVAGSPGGNDSFISDDARRLRRRTHQDAGQLQQFTAEQTTEETDRVDEFVNNYILDSVRVLGLYIYITELIIYDVYLFISPDATKRKQFYL